MRRQRRSTIGHMENSTLFVSELENEICDAFEEVRVRLKSSQKAG